MDARIQKELELLRHRHPELEYVEQGRWVRIPSYQLPCNPVGWNRTATEVAFQIPTAYPGTPPYGIYVPVGIRFNGGLPGSYSEPASTSPPFQGSWGIFSWTTEDGQWYATADVISGRNLVNWVQGFGERFRQGA